MSPIYIFMRLTRFAPLLLAALGAGAFFFHYLNISETVSLFFIGPIIYLAAAVNGLLSQYIAISKDMQQYGLLLPACILYFGLIGFLIKQLLEEKGLIKILTFMTVIGFFIFIHFFAWSNLTDYLSAPRDLLAT